MQGMQREFQTICLMVTKLSNTCRQTQVQAGGERSEPPCLYNNKIIIVRISVMGGKLKGLDLERQEAVSLAIKC